MRPGATTVLARRRGGAVVGAPHYVGSLLAHRQGFADTVTGGAAGPILHVTNLADSGVGSLRDALAVPGAKWIVIDPSVRGRTTGGAGAVLSVPADTTIDGRGASLEIDPGLAVEIAGTNVILANLKITGPTTTNTSADAVRTAGVPDLIWLHQLSLYDTQDGLFDITGYGTTVCRVTVSRVKFGPHPGPAGVIRGQLQGKASLVGNRSIGDRATAGKISYVECLWEGCDQRNPYIQAAIAHVYRSAVSKWGDAGGAGYGSECDTDNVAGCELRVEGTVFRPYLPGELHLGYGTVMARCSIEALIRRSNSDGQRRIYQANNLLLYGAKAGLSILDSTTTSTGRNGHTVEPEVDFKDAVFTPPYSYSAPTPDEGLVDRLRVSAGWHDVPVPV